MSYCHDDCQFHLQPESPAVTQGLARVLRHREEEGYERLVVSGKAGPQCGTVGPCWRRSLTGWDTKLGQNHAWFPRCSRL